MGSLLKGKLALVTGSGSGIGRAICQAFANHGATLLSVDIDKVKGTETKNIMGSSKHAFVEADVSDSESVDRVLSFAVSQYHRPPEVVVNCAGVVQDRTLLKMTEDEWDWVIDVNLKGPFLITQKFAAAMIKEKKEKKDISGSIINVSSIVGKTGNYGQANYAASKAGLLGLTKTTAKEMGKYGIRCNAVCPGFITTEMTAKIPEDMKKILVQQTPLQRMGTTEDIADVCVFLASNMSRFITGTTIDVTGGLFT